MATARTNPNRDSVTTINQDGSRMFLHPSDVSGRFTIWRRIVGVLLVVGFILLPWIPINGNPAIFFDVVHRRFHIIGLTFAFQDLWLAFFFITGLGFSLFVVSALFGRIWCGWTCPQTVLLEHFYRRIERWIEGDAAARKKLDAAPWTNGKIFKRVLKHGLFVLLSAIIAHIFLAYFISIPLLYHWMQTNPLEHIKPFIFVFIFTGILYFNFAWFREQLCLVICPYGRLQSALVDDDSVIIGYDEKRGEPRGPAKQEGFGDCINCNRCVQVCPTGIDIRQGLQLECIGCANCIDACDTIMKKIGRPTGLVRYDSLNGLAGLKTRFLRPRLFLYTILLCLGATVATVSFSKLKPANLTLTRMTTSPFIVDETGVRNQFMVRIINKTNQTVHFEVTASTETAESGHLQIHGFENGMQLAPMEEAVQPLVILVPLDDYTAPFPLTVEASGTKAGKPIQISKTIEFLGPHEKYLEFKREEIAREQKSTAPPPQ